MNNVLRTGTALAITVAIGYALCALVFVIWPGAALQFMNGLFHGLDFGTLRRGAVLFDFGSFLTVLIIMAAWAFGIGALFGWIFGRLGNKATR